MKKNGSAIIIVTLAEVYGAKDMIYIAILFLFLFATVFYGH
jgi:hypothetical protein